MSLRIDDYALDGRTHAIEVHGQVDLAVAPEFRDRILGVIRDGGTRVVLDLSGVSFVDSTALGVLARALDRLRGPDGVLSLVVTDYDIERLLQISGLGTSLKIYRSRDDALEDMAGAESA